MSAQKPLSLATFAPRFAMLWDVHCPDLDIRNPHEFSVGSRRLHQARLEAREVGTAYLMDLTDGERNRVNRLVASGQDLCAPRKRVVPAGSS